jgi:hypothetical protein
LIRCRAVKARMWAPAIIEVEVTADRSTGLADAVVGLQMSEQNFRLDKWSDCMYVLV